MRLSTSGFLVAVGMMVTAAPAFAAQSFSDVPQKHYAYDAVEYLKQKGMMDGYKDGTFKPDQKVNRAEALKMIVTPFLTDASGSVSSAPYADVAAGDWFAPAVAWALKQGAIDGPPKSAKFNPSRNITKSEFLKMFMGARKIDANSFGDVKITLSRDLGAKDWQYPYMRYAIASSMTVATSDGRYAPNSELTRGDVAVLIYRFYLYRAGQRTQALLSETEKELSKTIDALSQHDVTAADYTSARALLMIRGAHEIRPEEPMVKVIVKITEGYRSLVRAFRAASAKDWDAVIKLSGDAWYSGDQARKISEGGKKLADQLQQYSKSFANQARSAK
jgi:hypothetical protein